MNIILGQSKARDLWRMFLMLVVKYEVISQSNRQESQVTRIKEVITEDTMSSVDILDKFPLLVP